MPCLSMHHPSRLEGVLVEIASDVNVHRAFLLLMLMSTAIHGDVFDRQGAY